jgi:CubicO group peptidase (beta-lactamase class C family)
MTTDNRLPRSIPEAQGIASPAIHAFVEQAEKSIDALHSFMLLRHGQVVAEGWWAPYAPERPHMLFSLSKSFTSTAIGLAVAEGRLSVDDPVLSFFPEDAPARVSANLAAMRVRHLLSMSTGHAEEAMNRVKRRREENWARAFLARPVKYEPGTHFVYNSGATYMLSAILQKLVGTRMLHYLQPRLFEPLGIVGATWETCPRGIDTGGWGLSIKTEDIACLGQLYLQKGVWNGQPILPEAWVQQATSSQISNAGVRSDIDWQQGYGYQFWRCRHNAYRGDGAFGQYCLVMPDQDAVLAITSGIKDMQAVLDLVWSILLPSMGAAPLPANPTAQQALARKLASLALPLVQGQAHSPWAARVSGKRYLFESNDLRFRSVILDFGPQGCTYQVRAGRGTHRVACGAGTWGPEGTFPMGPIASLPVVASGAWTAEGTYTVRQCYVEAPFIPTFTFRFSEEGVTLTIAENVSFGPTEHAPLMGKLASSE